ncbi:MAG: hypothetical protein AAF280_13665 [Pseudomonadota bacterium]
MYLTDPFQFSAAGYRLMGIMVEQQMRVVKVLGDAAMASHPLMASPVPRRDAAPVKAKATIKAVTHAALPAKRPSPTASKRPRQPSPPRAFPQAPANGTPAHPAE